MIHIRQDRNPDDDVNVIVPVSKTPKRVVIQYDSSKITNILVSPLLIRLVGLVAYESNKDVP